MSKEYKASLVQIRYNTESDGQRLCWRLLIDGREELVNGIQINKPCWTTTDWLEDKQTYKHHISVKDCKVSIDESRLIAVID